MTVEDRDLLAAMDLLRSSLGVRCEPSGAAGVAALLAGRMPAGIGRVGIVLSGSNIAPARFEQLVGDYQDRKGASAAATQH